MSQTEQAERGRSATQRSRRRRMYDVLRMLVERNEQLEESNRQMRAAIAVYRQIADRLIQERLQLANSRLENSADPRSKLVRLGEISQPQGD